jgi:hypothetical protein
MAGLVAILALLDQADALKEAFDDWWRNHLELSATIGDVTAVCNPNTNQQTRFIRDRVRGLQRISVADPAAQVIADPAWDAIMNPPAVEPPVG